MGKSPAVDVAKEKRSIKPGVVILSTGVAVRLHPVPPMLVDDAQSRVKYPDVPMWHDPERDRDVPNENDPKYLAAVAEANRKRAGAVMDTLLMFGLELEDGLPASNGWLRKLMVLDRAGAIGLDAYDLEDPTDLEFLYKRYIAVGIDDWGRLSRLMGMTTEDIEHAEELFRGDAGRGSDNAGEAKESEVVQQPGHTE